MNKFIMAVMASSCLLGAQVASAQVHSDPYVAPDATPAWVFQGTLAVSKQLNLNCVVTLQLSGADDIGDLASGTPTTFSHTDFDNLTATISLGGPDARCATITPSPVGPPDVGYDGTNLTLTDLFVDTISVGDCRGNLAAEWDGAGLILDNVTLPQDTAGGPCVMDGYLDLISPVGGQFLP